MNIKKVIILISLILVAVSVFFYRETTYKDAIRDYYKVYSKTLEGEETDANKACKNLSVSRTMDTCKSFFTSLSQSTFNYSDVKYKSIEYVKSDYENNSEIKIITVKYIFQYKQGDATNVIEEEGSASFAVFREGLSYKIYF